MVATARDLVFLTTPGLWSTWPFLPLVRRAGGSLELGVLCDLRGLCNLCGFSATVFRMNLFCVPPSLADLLALPHDTFDTAEELYAAGWRVD